MGRAVDLVANRGVRRSASYVRAEYGSSWRGYRERLETSRSLADWLYLRGFEDTITYYHRDGRLAHGPFDAGAFYRRTLARALADHFPDARSVTEFGCGPGRNVLFLKDAMPHLTCYGYELTPEGVETAMLAAGRFGLDVSFSQLDFVEDPPERYVFPPSDVGFTMFALEQIPERSGRALAHIANNVTLGSAHIEPVPEHYPWSVRGLLGRVNHQRADYLRHFERVVRAAELEVVERTTLRTAHNALMFPTVYVLKKRS